MGVFVEQPGVKQELLEGDVLLVAASLCRCCRAAPGSRGNRLVCAPDQVSGL